jgi:hypothetical protein
MPDREKVIKGLECCTFILGKRKCNECPYQPDNGCYQMQNDFHDLLKEWEPKQVLSVADSVEGIEVGYCPSCDRAIVNKKIDETKFCKFCGQAVKWE